MKRCRIGHPTVLSLWTTAAALVLSPWVWLVTPPAGATFGITLTTDRASYAPGDTIAAQLVVSHRTGEAVVLHFNSGQRYDFQVEDAAGTVVWRWSDDRAFMQMLGEELVGPGREELVYRERFPAPAAPGRYRVVGSLRASDRPMSAAVTLAVVARGRE